MSALSIRGPLALAFLAAGVVALAATLMPKVALFTAIAAFPGIKAFAIFALIFGLLILRQPLLVILLAVAAYVHLVWGAGKLNYIVEDMWVGLDKEVILSIPLFILCGNVMTRGSIAQRLINILAAMTRRLPGGLAVACILSCAVFAAISGSSIVTMLAIGSVMYPAMRQAGYDLKFSLGAIMSGGTLGIIIPAVDPDDHLRARHRDQHHRTVRGGLWSGLPADLRLLDLRRLVQLEHADGEVRMGPLRQGASRRASGP